MRLTHYNPLHYFLLASFICISLFFSIFSNNAVSETSFLDVEEAYPLSVLNENDQLQLNWSIANGYYLYADKVSVKYWQDGKQAAADLSMPTGKIKYDENFGKELEVHYNSLTASMPLASNLENAQFSVKFQGCADAGLCYPPRTQYFSFQNGQFVEVTKDTFKSLTAGSVDESLASASSTEAEVPAEPIFLPFILLGALLGGFILNLMPCVFPVLSLKALSLAHGDAATHHRNGWAYTAGIVVSFLLVAVILIVAKETGESLGWGFQLQQPIFVAGLVYLFVLLGLNLAGFFEMGTSFMGVGQNLTQGNGASASFFTGVLAAVVASPCTAPFMASAVGLAVTQSAIIALLVFTFLGLGLAAPYLVLCYVPAIADRMPRPGPWMDRLKQLLSFPMFLTSAWLLSVLGSQTSAKTVSYIVVGSVAITFAIWIVKGQGSNITRWINRGFATAAVACAALIVVKVDKIDSDENSPWIPYSAETIAELRSSNRPTFVDLTADWCITCKANEAVAINRDSVQNFAKENDIALVKGDWTKNDPRITEYLESFGRNGVPLYVVYSSDPSVEPKILPQILTEELVLDAMRESVQ